MESGEPLLEIEALIDRVGSSRAPLHSRTLHPPKIFGPGPEKMPLDYRACLSATCSTSDRITLSSTREP